MRYISPIKIVPFRSVGKLKIGMKPEDIMIAIDGMRAEWNAAVIGDVQIVVDGGVNPQVVRYMNGPKDDVPFLFLVTYEDGRAAEIGVNRSVAEHNPVEFENLNLFGLPVDCLIPYLQRSYICVCDTMDEQLATTYEFSELGIRFWREAPFHQKLLADEEYVEMMGDTITDMFCHLYFDMVYVKSHSL